VDNELESVGKEAVVA